MSFVPCELHCHTLHSDGSFTVSELQTAAKNENLRLIALTDHNTFSGQQELDDSIIPAIRGIEWTTYFGHMLVLGLNEFVDWRDAVPDNIDEKILAVRNGGGIVGVAHPFQLGSPMCTGGRWEFNVKKWENVNYIEIWHQEFSPDNYENEKATEFWKSLLDRGYRIAASYGRDWHRPCSGRYGFTLLDIDGEVNPENALEAVSKGRTVVSAGPEFYFTVKQGQNESRIGETVKSTVTDFKFYLSNRTDIKCTKIKVVTNGNTVAAECDADKKNITLSLKENSWYICELWGVLDSTEQPVAITSPIYTGGKS